MDNLFYEDYKKNFYNKYYIINTKNLRKKCFLLLLIFIIFCYILINYFR